MSEDKTVVEETKDNEVIVEDQAEGTEGNEGQIEETKEEKKYTDKDVDEIVNKKFAKWKKQEQAKIDEAEKLAKMNADEKREHELKKLKEENEKLKKEKTFFEMKKVASQMLNESGIVISDDLITTLVSSNADETKANVEGFTAAFNSAVEKEINNRLKGKTPKATGNKVTLTKAQILAIEDDDLRQQKIMENMHLFN